MAKFANLFLKDGCGSLNMTSEKEQYQKERVMLTLREDVYEMLERERKDKGYLNVQMVLYEIVGDWYAKKRDEALVKAIENQFEEDKSS